MSRFAVQPDRLVAGGRRMSQAADEVSGIGDVLAATLSGLGQAAGHPGIAAAAGDAAVSWRTAAKAWAVGSASLGDAVVAAAAAYADVDAGQARWTGVQP